MKGKAVTEEEEPTGTEKGTDCFDKEINKAENNVENCLSQQRTDKGKPKSGKGSTFRQKQFLERTALLEQHFDLNNGQSVGLCNFFLAIFALATMCAWAQDYSRHGNPLHHFWLVKWNFEQLPQTMLLWTAMLLSVVAFPFSGLWLLANFSPKWAMAAAAPLWISLYLCYQLAFFYWSLRILFWMQLKGACAFVITCENTRLAMKSHSFVRENFARAKQMLLQQNSIIAQQEDIANTQSDSDCQPTATAEEWPSLGQFLYFVFCPSLIYQDAYPRSESRCWRKVGQHLGGCLASMYLVNISFTQAIIPLYSQLRYPEDMEWHLLLSTVFPSIIPGAVCLFLGIFYGLLHSWLSMFAEVMQYADRHFYSNWWSSRNMAEYYRNWNLVVHEWLYYYVYRDISLLVSGQLGHTLATISVFLLSACFHEYWFGVSLRMFYPVIFTLYFVFGGIFFLISKFIKRPYIWNIIMWWNLLVGTGIFVTFYSSEWYARRFCFRIYQNDLWDILVPRVWVCAAGNSPAFL